MMMEKLRGGQIKVDENVKNWNKFVSMLHLSLYMSDPQDVKQHNQCGELKKSTHTLNRCSKKEIITATTFRHYIIIIIIS